MRRLRYSDADSHFVTVRKTITDVHAGGLREAWLYASKSNLQDSLTRRQGQPKCLIRRAKLHSSTTLD